MSVLVVINDPPYGSERPLQALRLADAMLKTDRSLELTVYLTGDGVVCAKSGQKTPADYYNIETMLTSIAQRGVVLACRTCLEARGLKREELVEGVVEARLGELAALTLEADKVLIY